MAWSDPVIDYCERRGHAFWAEPLNALTNIAFLLAAAGAFALWRRHGGRDVAALALIGVTALVGVGSFVFHTLATRGAMLLDVIPIALFIYGYFLLALRRFFSLGALVSVGATLLFAAGSYVAQELFHGLRGSVAYLPALGAIAGFAAARWPRDRRTARRLALAALVFSISLTLRTVDADVCAAFPYGAHFFWHLLNAVVLWLLLRAAILAELSEQDLRDPEREGQRAHRGVREDQRPDIAGDEIGGGPGEPGEEGVHQQDGIAIAVVHQRKHDG